MKKALLCLVVLMEALVAHGTPFSNLRTLLLRSAKCLGGRCIVLGDHSSDGDLCEHVELAGAYNAYHMFPDSLEELLSESSSDVNTRNLVLIWQNTAALLKFLASSQMGNWKEEHYSAIDGTSELLEKLQEASVYLRLDSKIFLVVSQNGHRFMHEVYGKSIKPTKIDHHLQKACTWPSTKEPCDPMFNIWGRRRDLTGVEIVGTYTFVGLNAQLAPDGHTLTGYFPELFYLLQESMNFTYRLLPGKGIGRMLKNGSFTGVVGTLQRKEADINIAGQSLRHDRAMATDVSPPLQSFVLAIMIKSSSAYQMNTWDMLAIFERDAWTCFTCLVLVALLTLAVIYLLVDPADLVARSFAQAVAFTGSSLMLKTYRYVRNPKASKVLCLAIGFLSILIFAYLRAGLLSKLAIRTWNLPLKTITDLLDHDVHLLIITGGNVHATFLNAPQHTLIGQLWARNVLPHNTTLHPSQMNKVNELVVKNHKYASVLPAFVIYTSPDYPCTITTLEEDLWKVQNTFGYQKDGPLTELFNYHLNQMMANGVVKKMQQRYFDVAPVDCALDSDPQLGYNSLFGLFLILLAGVGLSLVLFLAEAAAGILNLREALFSKQQRVGTLPRLTELSERERMLGELSRLRAKLREKEELIENLKGCSSTAADQDDEIREISC